MTFARREMLYLMVAGAFPVISRIARAQTYPLRPVRVIVPYGPGGPTDIVARLVAQKLSEQVGKQFYVENLGGGGGNIGMAHAAKAPPDGYTILVVPPNITRRTNESLGNSALSPRARRRANIIS
jgi:tripartite-type tricarboxylate transporter receptor subunit TctC